jgi:CarboxypepD_reg-like domain
MIVCMVLLVSIQSLAQTILNKNISIQVNKQRLDNVLEIISNNGNFYFSYNSSIVKRDSLVTMNFTNRPVRDVLNYLFSNRYDYIESGNYIILRRKAISIAATIKQTPTEEKNYFLAGYIIDEFTGERLNNASIYEPLQLASDLTDEQGTFTLKLKSRYKTATITVSKDSYKDTTLTIQPKLNQQLIISLRPQDNFTTMITISPEDYFLPDTIEVKLPTGETVTYTKEDTIKVQRSWIGKFLLSSKQRMQSINLGKFFTTRAFQISLVPGLSTQGKLSPQITTAFSVNVQVA